MKKLSLLLILIVVATVGYGQFIETAATFVGVQNSSSDWGDYDNDNDLDLLLTGTTGTNYVTKLYRYDGNDVFTETAANFTGIEDGSVEFGDLNNDGFLDVFVSGYAGNQQNRVFIYINNGNQVFTQLQHNLPSNLSNMSTDWADFDNDGDLDVLVTGFTGQFIPYTDLFRNDNGGVFTALNIEMTDVYYSSSDWGDYDNDGDLDLILSGIYYYDTSVSRIYSTTRIYRNQGNNQFTMSSPSFISTINGYAKWCDYDSDGFLDVLLSGSTGTYGYNTNLYHNLGIGGFEDNNVVLPPLSGTSASWGDYDNDGDSDLLIAGATNSNSVTKLFRNNGNSSFIEATHTMSVLTSGSSNFIDYDNDGKIDIFMSGDIFIDPWTHTSVSKLYRNYTAILNTAPLLPENISINIIGSYLNFGWNPATDTQTPQNGLTYSLRIGTTPGGNDILSSMASPNGYRKKAVSGYANSNCSWKIKLSSFDANHTYYWSVQAVDGALAGSAFAPEQQFTLQESAQLLSPSNITYTSQALNSLSLWSPVVIKNTGLANLNISELHFYHNPSIFQATYAHLGNAIMPGQTDTIFVRFAPTTIGTINDTLYIVSNALNTPVLKIRLSGTGICVPPAAPQTLNIAMQGNNAILTWEAITTDTQGNPMTPDCYIVLHSNSPYAITDDYYYLNSTTSLSYSHFNVGRFRSQMYYRVIAYKDYGRGNLPKLAKMNGSERKVRYKSMELK